MIFSMNVARATILFFSGFWFCFYSSLAHAQTATPNLPIQIVAAVGHSAEIKAVAYSPNGKTIASASNDLTVKLWDVGSTRLLRTFVGHTKEVRSVAFSIDGKTIASASQDKTIRLWQAETGQELGTIKTGAYPSVVFAPDGKRLISGDADSVKIWDIAGTSELSDLRMPHSNIQAIAVSANGRSIASGGYSDGLKIWDQPTGKLVFTIKQLQRIHAIAFSPDSSLIAVGYEDGSIALIDYPSRRTIRLLKGHKKSTYGAEVFSVAFSPDGKTLSSSGEDGTVRFWNVSTGELRSSSPRGRNRIYSVTYSPDGNAVVSSSDTTEIGNNSVLKTWDARTGKTINTYRATVLPALSAALSSNSNMIAAGTTGAVNIWDSQNGEARSQFAGHNLGVHTVQFAPDGHKIISGSFHELKFWNAITGRLEQPLGEQDNPTTMAFSQNGKLIAGAGDSSVLRIWNAETGSLQKSVTGLGKSVETLALSSSGKLLAVAEGESIRLLDVTKGAFVKTFRKHGNTIRSIALTRDETIMASGSIDGIVRLTDIISGTEIGELKLPNDGALVWKVSFSNNDKLIAAGDNQGTVYIWDRTSRRLIRSFVAHQGTISNILFSDNDERLVTAGHDGSIRHWSTEGTLIATSIAGDAWITITPEGFFTSSVPKTIGGAELSTRRVWLGIEMQEFVPAPSKAGASSKPGVMVAHAIEGSPSQVAGLIIGDVLLQIGDQRVQRPADVSPVVSSKREGEESELIVSRNGQELRLRVKWELRPEGALPGSLTKLLYLVRGFDIISIDQVYQSLYRPDLVREKLAGDPRGLVRDAASQLDLRRVVESGNGPLVRFVSPASGLASGAQISAVAELTDRGGGIGRVEWRVNGVTVGIETPTAPVAGQPLRLTRALSLDPGSNAIEVVAYNSANFIASLPARISITIPAALGQVAAPQQSRLFVIAAGINDYADSRFKLAGSVRDAEALSKAFAATGTGLYKSVEVKLLIDSDVSTTKLDAAFAEVAAQASPSDVFLLYLAGHGKTVDGRYYFVPRYFSVGQNADEKAINTAVVAQGIPQEQWQRWFASIPARKSMILFDTCESGTITVDAAQTKALEQSAANDRLAQATGRSIITASSGTEVAFEGYRGHGLFTYNLLDALDRADSDGNGTIEINELAAYVYAQVTTLSEQVFKKRQEPQIRIASSYPLTKQGRVLAGDLPTLAQDNAPTLQLAQTANLQIKPSNGASVVRSLSAKTTLTVLRSEGEWSLVASGGKPLGYVATRDLVPAR